MEVNELKTIFAEQKEISVGSKIIKINTIKLGDIPIITEILTKVVGLLPKFQKESTQNQAILEFLTNDIESVVKFLKVTTDLDDSSIRALNLGAATLITTAVIKENASFFAQHVAPLIKEATKGVSKDLGSSKSKS